MVRFSGLVLILSLSIAAPPECAAEGPRPGADAALQTQAEQFGTTQGGRGISAEQLGAVLGMKPDSSAVRALVSGRKPANLPGFRRPGFGAGKSSEGRVIAHLRASGGRPFSKPPEIDAESLIDKREALSRAKQIVDEELETVRKSLVLEPLPRCTRSDTKRIERPYYSKAEEKMVYLDILYVEPGNVPLNPDEEYGAAIKVRTWDTAKPDAFAFAARNLGVDCLPYRFRSTGRFVYRMRGDHALKNYDEGHGKKVRKAKQADAKKG